MKRITMLKTESALTDKGPLVLQKGSTFLIDDWIADSMIGRGYARLADATDVLPGEPVEVPDAIDFTSKNIGELRELGRQRGVPGYRKMTRAQLISALEPVGQPAAPFEKLNTTGGVTPPEFTRE